MFRMKQLEVVNWDYWQRMVLPLDANIVTLVGPNGSGKTTTLDALRTILHLDCSDKRDYKQYIRHNGSDFAWIRAVVTNEKQGRRTKRPFRFMEDEVTLVCRIKRSGSSWTREYAMAPGNVTIEDFESKEQGVEWVKTTQYVSFLSDAGLSPSIRKVLSLEQGDTDKLCKYNPRALLQLVFDAFGDKACLDDYTEAKEKQQEAAREMDVMRSELTSMERQVDVLDGKCQKYHEWNKLTSDISHIKAKVLPLFEVIDIETDIEKDSTILAGFRDKLDKLSQEQAGTDTTIEANGKEITALNVSLEQHQEQLDNSTEGLQKSSSQAQAAAHVLSEKKRLEDIVKKQADTDVEALSSELSEVEQATFDVKGKLHQAKQKLSELKNQQGRIKAGRSIAPSDLLRMEEALKAEGISFSIFSDIVEIKDKKWAVALEAVLSPSKHIVLLDNQADSTSAMSIGERLRYRHFVVSDRDYAGSVKKGSLYSHVKFTAKPPAWLSRMLNDIQCVENAAEGASKCKNSNWITPTAYYKEARGSRQISGDGHKFGAKHQSEAIKKQIDELEGEISQLSTTEIDLLRKISVIKEALGTDTDAPQQLANRALEFTNAQETYNLESKAARSFSEDVARLDGVVKGIQEKIQNIVVENTRIEASTRSIKEEIGQLTEKISDYAHRANESKGNLKKLVQRFTEFDLSDEAKNDLRRQFKSSRHASATLDVEMQRLAEGEGFWETDPSILIRRDKIKGDYISSKKRLDRQQKTLDSTMQTTDHAREAYIDILRATVSKYISNLDSLAHIADVEIKAERPKLENTDLSLAQAGLGISFNFDEKGFIDLDDGEASGGQQVIKSLILLMGLMMGPDSTDIGDKGFIFIDEPYSHLDIFNIDKVGSFLKATGAQFIISTPITHNSNIFDPAYITLSTRKKMPGKKWAAPIMHQTRRNDDLAPVS